MKNPDDLPSDSPPPGDENAQILAYLHTVNQHLREIRTAMWIAAVVLVLFGALALAVVINSDDSGVPVRVVDVDTGPNF